MKSNLDGLDLKTRKFVQDILAKGRPSINEISISEARKLFNQLQSLPIERLSVKIEDTIISTDKGPVSIRIIRPINVTAPLPVVMYFHGGGWAIGDVNTHDRLIREIAVGAHVAVVFVNYSRAPEAQYPIALEEAYAATKYISEQGSQFNLDSTRLAVAGDSAGANLATVVTLLAKERGGPNIQYQALLFPVTDAAMNTRSYEEFQDGPWITRADVEWYWNVYEANPETRLKPTLSPLQASVEMLRGLPPALVITAENDVLRDEGEAYAHKLMEAGVDVTAVRLLGTFHDIILINLQAQTPAARSATLLLNALLREMLGGI